MKMENKELDQLTRRLMAGTAESPSSSLNMRIMALIRRQKKPDVAFVPSMPSLANYLGWFLAYIALAAGAFYYLYSNKLDMSTIWEELTPYLSLILTASLVIPLYIAGVWWDKRQNKKQDSRKKLPDKHIRQVINSSGKLSTMQRLFQNKRM